MKCKTIPKPQNSFETDDFEQPLLLSIKMASKIDSTQAKPPCAPWEKGEDCSFNMRNARIALLVVMCFAMSYSLYLTMKVSKRNRYSTSRPVVCLLLVTASLFCDIIEQGAVLSSMIPNNLEKWYSAAYGTNTFDSLGDIFLMLSLWYFAEIWCDNIALLRHKAGDKEGRYKGLKIIKVSYGLVFFATIPISLIFAFSSYVEGLYDKAAIAYMSWGAFSGFLILSPLALYMKYIIHSVSNSVKRESSYRQIKFQTDLNLAEQVSWNILLIIALITFTAFLSGGNKSGLLIGFAAVSIQISWLLIHAQILGFFAFVPRAQNPSPTFDEHLLRTLLDGGESTVDGNGKSLQMNKLDRRGSITEEMDSRDASPIGQEMSTV